MRCPLITICFMLLASRALLAQQLVPGEAITRTANLWTQPQNFAAGLQAAGVNPTVGNDPNNRRLVDLACTTDSLSSNPSFTDENCLEITLNARRGQNSYAGGTNAKKTFLPLLITGNMTAAGQRFLLGEMQNCYGMGDCFAETRSVNFAGANIAGDEGEGFQSVSYLRQQDHLVKATIVRVERSLCNTVLTQVITASAAAQTVTVSDSSGCSKGDWVEVQQQAPTNHPNHEAVELTGAGAGTISGIFHNNHPVETPISPALVLGLSSTREFGEGRVLVNVSGRDYASGTITSVAGYTLAGSNTAWSTDMVGGTPPNIGCIAMDADDYHSAPFDGARGPLKAWYQIADVESATSLAIFRTSLAGDRRYHGNAPGSRGAYLVRPCAEVLSVVGTTVVLEASTARWSVGDIVELSISPYPDVSGWQNHIAVYTPGGTLRRGLELWNTGARSFARAIEIATLMPRGDDVDRVGWETGVAISGAATGITIDDATQVALRLPAAPGAAIDWGPLAAGAPVNQYIGYTTVGGRAALLMHGLNGDEGVSDRGALSLSESSYPDAWANFNGMIGIGAISAGDVASRLRFHRDNGDPQAATDYIDLLYAYPGSANGNFDGLVFTSSHGASKLLTLDFDAATIRLGDSARLAARVAIASKTTQYRVLASDTGTHFDNTGASSEVDFLLPAAEAGLNYCFTVNTTRPVKVMTSGYDRIAIGAKNSAAGGSLGADGPFASVCIEAHGVGQWIATQTPDRSQWSVD